jgi:hypothetical protein
MKQQDKLRTTLREYYDNQEVPFNDYEWEQASALLNAARRKRKIRFSLLILTTFLSVLFIALFNFPQLTSTDKHQVSSFSNQKSTSETSPQSLNFHTPKVSESKIKIQVSGQSTTASVNSHKVSVSSQNPVIVNQQNLGDITRVNSMPDKKSTHSESTLDSEPKSHINIPEVQTDKASPVSESTSTEPELVSIEPENSVNKEDSTSNITLITPVAFVKSTINHTNKQYTIKQEIPEDSKENVETGTVENLTQNQAPFAAKEITQVSINVLPNTSANSALNNNKIKAIDSTNYSDTEQKALTTVANTSNHTLIAVPITETEITIVDTASVLPSFNNLAGEGIFYEAGAAWYYGWKGSENLEARGFSPLVGVNYMNQLNNRCALSFGFHYLQVRNLSNSSKTSRLSTYNYGEQSRVTVITPSTVHYLVLPLRFQYYANRYNSFGSGINLAYLLNVDAKVTSFDESPGYTGNHTTVKLGGYTEGFSWFDCQLAFFYRRRIGNSLALQAEIFTGLTDVKQDEFFGLRGKERNSGAKLSLVYYAFRKKDK